MDRERTFSRKSWFVDHECDERAGWGFVGALPDGALLSVGQDVDLQTKAEHLAGLEFSIGRDQLRRARSPDPITAKKAWLRRFSADRFEASPVDWLIIGQPLRLTAAPKGVVEPVLIDGRSLIYDHFIALGKLDPITRSRAEMNALSRFSRVDRATGTDSHAVLVLCFVADQSNNGGVGLVVFLTALNHTTRRAAGD
ncbi:MAG TPA: hypothetical protein VER96_31805 [Polyangiaceae bacterium]|nr:hypothetical protein [Polyangiaceae bacterium]